MWNFVNETAIKQNKGILKMELAKISALGTLCINVFLYISAWFANLDNTKSTILFIVALCMSMYRFYRWDRTSKQNERLKEIDIRQKDLQTRREELEIMERENRLIRENL